MFQTEVCFIMISLWHQTILDICSTAELIKIKPTSQYGLVQLKHKGCNIFSMFQIEAQHCFRLHADSSGSSVFSDS